MANYTGTFSNLLEDSTQDTSTISNVGADTSQQTYQGTFSNLVTPSITTTGEPSNLQKFQYGLASETYLLGDLKRLGKATIQSLYSGKSFSEERREEEELRLKGIYEDHPWAESGQYDNDAEVWAGRIGIMATDPVYWLMPWARAAQAGKIIGKGGWELAKLGAGVGAGDTLIRDFARTGKFSPTNILIGAGAGAVLSPAVTGLTRGIGMGVNKALPNLFKDKPKEIIKTIKDVHKKNYGVDEKTLERLYNIPTLPRLQKMWQSIAEGENVYKTIFEPIETFVKQIDDAVDIVKLIKDKNALFSTIAQEQKQLVKKGLKSPFELKFKVLGGKTLEASSPADIKKFKTKILGELNKKKLAFNKVQQRKHTNLLINVTKEYHKATGLTGQAMRMLSVNLTRPLVGTGMGATAGSLFGNDENFKYYMMAGGSVGGLHRILMRGGIKGIPMPTQIKFANILKKDFWTNLDRHIRIGATTTQQSKLSQRGPVMDEFSVAMFDRPADTIRLDWLGRVHKDAGSSIGLVGTGTSVEQMAIKRWANLTDSLYEDVLKGMNKNAQRDALRIVRGASSKGMSDDAKQLAGKINSWLDEHRAYYNEVGLTEKEILKNYFPRKFNYKIINQSPEHQEQFLQDVTDIFQNITKKASKTNKIKIGIGTSKKDYVTSPLKKAQARKSAESYFKSITDTHENPIIDFKKLERGETLNVQSFKLPLNQHLDFERILKGSYKDVEGVLEKWLVNDVGAVLTDLARTTSKSVEFARVFGPKGEMLKTFIKRITDQYKDAKFTKVGGMYGKEHRADLQGIRDAVNSYFGRYVGNFGRGGNTTKSMSAVLSTLANFNMMDKVTIANIGDLIQPFQNSRYFFSAVKGMMPFQSNVSKQMALKNTKLGITNLKDAFVGSDGVVSPLSKTVGSDNFLSLTRSANEKFFKLIGLEAITNLSRKYAYNVGAIDAHKAARSIIQGMKEFRVTKISDLMNNKFYADEIRHLSKVGAIQTDKTSGRIINSKQLIEFGNAKNLTEAMKSKSSANIIDRVGTKAADRDAIIPQVGNRLLFTQDKQPLIRLIGQFSSWAMAKSAQTNAMLTRIEDGNLRTAVGMLGALTVFGGIKDLRDYAKFGEFDTKDNIDDDPMKWLADANQMSGNLGWLPTLLVNQFAGYGSGRPIEFFPAISMASDISKAMVDSTPFSTADWDKAIREWYQVAPAPTLRGLIDRSFGGIGLTYKKDFNIVNDAMNSVSIPANKFALGGVADFNHAYSKARNEKKELFVWDENEYTTKQADESDKDFKEFLGVEKFEGEKITIKNKPFKPAIQEDFDNALAPTTQMSAPIIKKAEPLKISPVEMKARYGTGFMYNNPVNVERTQDWAGSYDDMGYGANERFAIFDSPVMGIRAGIRDVNSKIDRIGGDITTILTEFAPPKDQPSIKHLNNYIKFVKNKLGKSVVTKADVPDMIKAMIQFENKPSVANYYLENPDYFTEAIRLEKKDLPKSHRYNKGGAAVRQGYRLGAVATKVAMPIINRALTQITKTKGSYKKFNNILKDYNADKKILDFGSGLGHGTPLLKGTKIISHEPYAQPLKITNTKGRLPDYKDVDTLIQREGLNSQDAVIHHMVTNVIDNPLERQLTIKTIGDLLKKDGISILTTRSKADVLKAKTKEAFGDGFIIGKGSEKTFQKGFGQDELKKYVKNILGDAFEVFKIPNKYKISGSGVIIKKLDDAVKLSEGGQVRQLLNGGGSTYRRNARESYIASSNKPKASSSNTNKPPTEKVWDESKKDDPTTKVDYTSKPSDDGGNGGVSKIIKTLKPDIVDVTIPIPKEDRDVRKEKMKRVFEDREMKAGAWKEFNLFGGEGKVGGELFLESAGQGLEIDTGMRADTTWQKGDTFIQGQYDSGDWSVAGKKGILEASIKGNEDNTSGYIGVNIPLSFKSGGLLDRKRS
ncbi:glucosaminidase [uncultured Mediterranean phage]|nr:glucosaminidase [uncultured Mediterranean phage]